MIICIPVLTNNGEHSEISEHFGSAPYYAVYDSIKELKLFIKNPGSDHEHGECRPVDVLSDYSIETVICRGMGPRAIMGLQNAGIRVCRSEAVTARAAIQEALCNELQEMDIDACCTEHNAHCG